MTSNTLEFHFNADNEPSLPKRLWRWFVRRDVQLIELKRTYRVSFRSGNVTNEATASWDWRDKRATKQMERELARMLEGQMSKEQAIWMADQLHGFLFANRELDIVFDRALQGPTENPLHKEIQIFADDESSLPLLANLPWELARDIVLPDQANDRLLLGTLASRPIVRAMTSSAPRTVKEARVRVLCCIANYEGDVLQFDAPAFDRAIKESLESQPVDLSFVATPNYLPRADETFAEINRVDPHVFIFVGHGKSDSGIPQLRFEDWIRVDEFAQHLAHTGQALLAIFIACDQSRLIASPAAQSGALTLLDHGVPAVVAMQGYVDPKRAEAFLGTFMKSLFITHSISQAAALGRVAMDKTVRDGDWSSDWVLPAVFRRGGQESERDQLSLILGHYQPALERLLSFVPPVMINLTRPALEDGLLGFLNEGTGLLQIAGGIGSGRTQLMRAVARDCITVAIKNRSSLARPIFYMDLDESLESTAAEGWFLSKLQSRFGHVRLLLASSTLTTALSASLASTELVGVLIRELDHSRVVLAIDHLRGDDTGFWTELMSRAAGLQNSLIIAVDAPDDLLPENVPMLSVPPFSLEETRAYVRRFVGEDISLADTWHESSGGTPLLLDGLRAFNKSSVLKVPGDIALRREGTIASRYIDLIRDTLTPEEFTALCVFAWFPGLIETELACRFIPQHDPFATLTCLVEKGVLSAVNRSGKDWLSLARLKANGLDPEFIDEAASELTARFDDEVVLGEYQTELDNLALQPGGLTLLRGVQSAYLAMGNSEMALDLASLLASPLKDQPFELYKFFIAVLDPKPDIKIRHSVWVRAAGLARRVGNLDRVDSFLSKLEGEAITQYWHAWVLNIKATLLKDRGKSEKTEEMLGFFEEAVAIAKAGIDGGIKDEEVSADQWGNLLSTLFHNRAAVLQFIARRRTDALNDIRQVQNLEQERNPVLTAAAMCQEVDIRLGQLELVDDWAHLLDLARRSYVILSQGQPTHDFAYCCYQYARYYRKRTANSDDDRSQNLRSASKYYEEAASVASEVGDFKLRAAAIQHWVRVCWEDLRNLSADDAAAHLDVLLPTLAEYHGDAYAARILRDTLFLRAQIEIASRGARSRELLRAASDASAAKPLSPGRRGEDSHRGIRIFVSYLENLRAEDQRSEAEGFLVDYRNLLNEWLETIHVDQPWETLTKLTEKEKLWAT